MRQTVNGQPAVFFDAPGGTQVPQQVIDAISEYLSKWNANLGGAFLTSQRSDLIVEQAHEAMADFFNCPPDEVVFGANMTTLTFALSRAIGRELKSGDELLVTCLDHDANVSPWVCLEERGAKVRTADIKTSDCTLGHVRPAGKDSPQHEAGGRGMGGECRGDDQRCAEKRFAWPTMWER